MPTNDDHTPDEPLFRGLTDDPEEDAGAGDVPQRRRRRVKLSRWARFKAWCKRHKALVILLTILLLLIAIILGWVWYLNRQIGNIPRFELDLERPDRPVKVENNSVNILLMGVDDPDGLPGVGPDLQQQLDSGNWRSGSFRSDALMVLHINSDRQSAQLVSIPRDSWVEVPGHGMAKINAALSYGGPSLAAQTIEDHFDLRIDHMVLIDFQGFRDLTDVLGGVEVYISSQASQRLSQGAWPSGMRNLNGEEALLYVRQRYGLSRGDFDRVQRQQAYLKAVLDKSVSRGTLLNPIKVTNLLEEIGDFIAVDAGFDNGEIRDLAIDSRNLHSGAIRFVTVPNKGTGRAGDQSIVVLDDELAIDMFAAIQKDQFESWYARNDVDEMPAGGKVD